MAQAGIGSTPHHPHRVGTGSTPDRSSGVGAGLKPASTTAPPTTEDRLYLCENATIHTPHDAGDGDSISSQVKRFQTQDVLFGKLRPYPAKVTCPKRNGVCVGESDRTHPVGAGFRPDIAHPVEAGLKPASTTAPRTTEDRLHLCENATILTPHGTGDGVSIGSQVCGSRRRMYSLANCVHIRLRSLARSAMACPWVRLAEPIPQGRVSDLPFPIP